MGVVYWATDTKLNREVAIKFLPEEFARDQQRMARFDREARLLASMNHPNIVTIFDIDQEDGIDIMVMEFVAGKTLDELIPRKRMRSEETDYLGWTTQSRCSSFASRRNRATRLLIRHLLRHPRLWHSTL